MEKDYSMFNTMISETIPWIKDSGLSCELAEERQLRYLLMAVAALLILLAVTALFFMRRIGRLERARLLADQERVAAERSRELAEQAEQARARFLATVSHEIRGPVGSIHNMAQLLIEADLPEEQSRLAGVLNQSSHFLLYIVNDVLDLSRMESGRLKLEAVDLDVRDVVENRVHALVNDYRIDQAGYDPGTNKYRVRVSIAGETLVREMEKRFQ